MIQHPVMLIDLVVLMIDIDSSKAKLLKILEISNVEVFTIFRSGENRYNQARFLE